LAPAWAARFDRTKRNTVRSQAKPCRMFKKARLLTHPSLARRDAPCPWQGRSEQLKMILPSLLVYVAQDDPDESPTARVQRGPSDFLYLS
jgi:hypothetical protein